MEKVIFLEAETVERLDFIAEQMSLSRSKVLRLAIDNLYNAGLTIELVPQDKAKEAENK